MAETLMEVRDLKKYYPVDTSLIARFMGQQRHVHAVDGVSFDIEKGEIFGLAGESGCGKTTTARCLTRLDDPTSGDIYFGDDRRNIAELEREELQEYRREAQVIFQDPFESMNDRFTVRKWVREPLVIHDVGDTAEREERVYESLEQAGLTPVDQFIDRYPHELSGGQRQRVAIARALVLNPSFIVADEPTSMLDVSVRASVLRVLNRLVEEEGVTLIYISHDLSLLRYICDRIAIMYQGRLAELGTGNAVLQDPKHPYTQSLVSAVPRADPREGRTRIRIPGEVEERIGGIEGCSFKDRCPYRYDRCDQDPAMYEMDGVEQRVACHLYDPEEDRPLPDPEGAKADADEPGETDTGIS
ncbi:MAG: ABC transporter ATP-binding protein [Halobacteriales archaeon]